MESRPAAMEASSQNPIVSPPVPPDFIITALPPDLLRMTIKMLPASNLFVAPVCRRFRDLYGEATKEKKEKHATYEYSITTEAALTAYLEEQDLEEQDYDGLYDDRNNNISMIGAGCGRTDWVERGGVFDESTCRAAAVGGQLRVLRWLRGRDCPWDSWTCRGAVEGGHLEVLKWAISNGCPYYMRDIRTISDPDFHAWFWKYGK